MEENRESIMRTLQEVAKIVTEMAGIQLGERQFPMIENRLKSRMLRLQLTGFDQYLNYLRNNRESEAQALLSLMTTHHTYFFREFSHFEFMLNRALPGLIEVARQRPDKTIHVLSAACSRGHEVYSLAMFFKFHLKAAAPDLKFQIWGTDIDPESVKHAKNGVYRSEELKQSPAMYLEGNWIRGSGQVREFSKVKPELKDHCHFTTGNLLSYDSFLQGKKFDIIFCRNVFIYFNSDQIRSISEKMMNALHEGGFFILGLSETLNGLNMKVSTVGPSVYQKAGVKTPQAVKVAPPPPRPKTIEVMCVDDSPAIHALLKKILVKEEGFQVTASAKNGREALEILKQKKFDIITLDLHMPELDGVGFLSERKQDATPVLVISSINRDDTSIAQKALSLGAKDYVEKPSLENLAQAGNEIRAKMKMILNSAAPQAQPSPVPKTELVKKPALPAAKVSSIQVKPATSSVNSKKSLPAPIAKSDVVKPDSRKGVYKVLIVDDSKTIRTLLSAILKKDSRFQVVGEAEKPSEVAALIEKTKPDVITLDIHMPEMNGVQLLQKIHPKYKIPTVMISSISREEGTYILDALAAGAIDYIQKPAAEQLGEVSRDICDRIASAAQARVQTTPTRIRRAGAGVKLDTGSLIVMGASTGGTEALKNVLLGLPQNIPPVLIVQHIPPVFSAAFADRLNQLCPFEVREARDGDEVKANLVLVAPGGKQMGIKTRGEKCFIEITDAAPVNRHKPSVDYLFQSVAQSGIQNVVAVILTGMGADGARQMKVLRDKGARTIAQDEATSVVFGMPREAIRLGGAEFTMALGDVSEKLLLLCQQSNKSKEKKVS